jgi:hypothetical protein
VVLIVSLICSSPARVLHKLGWVHCAGYRRGGHGSAVATDVRLEGAAPAAVASLRLAGHCVVEAGGGGGRQREWRRGRCSGRGERERRQQSTIDVVLCRDICANGDRDVISSKIV